MKFEAGKIYVVRKKCYVNREKWVKSIKDKVGGNYIHIKWIKSGKEELIEQSCILRKATERDEMSLLAELI